MMYPKGFSPTSNVWFLFLLIVLGACNSPGEEAQMALPEKVDFNFHIKPILSDRCFACHGPDKNKREAGLRLDQEEGALQKVLESGKHAFVPKDPASSEAYQRLLSEDPDLQMPPPESNLAVSDYEKALIKKWIEQGATYKKHWAFIPPQLPALPPDNGSPWIRNEIDHFTLAKMREKGFSPNPPAEKATLLRRVSMDLTGLPPTLEEIDAFLADDGPDAYEKVVDRLLASPHFGERMAMDWLDAARYADSHGYSQDGYREMYPWREWVIGAFNDNVPFDEFLVWQLAGDLLPNPTSEQVLATGFLRNHRINTEGGIVPEEYRIEYAADRTQTTATTFLGLTFECARCHDHKYDPISQEEYFGLFDFFNQVNEEGLGRLDGNSGPEILVPDEKVEKTLGFLRQKQDLYLQKVRSLDQQWEDLPADLLPVDLGRDLAVHLDFEEGDLIYKQGKASGMKDASLGHTYGIRGEPEIVSSERGAVFRGGAYDMVRIPYEYIDFEQSDAFSFSFWVKAFPESGFFELLHRINVKYDIQNGYDLTLRDGHLAVRLAHSLPANLIEVRSIDPFPVGTWTHVGVTYNGSGKASGVQIYFNGEQVEKEVKFDQLFQGMRHKRDLSVGNMMHLEEHVDEGFFLMDDLRIYRKTLSPVEVATLYGARENLSPEVLQQHKRQQSLAYRSLMDSVRYYEARITETEDSIVSVMVMQDLEKHRPTFVLDRGAYDAPTVEVAAQTPEAVMPFEDSYPANRLGLAQWLIHPEHPLTARVFVNRLWQQCFGQGIVVTAEDFGSQGDLPSHPELLDWLAVHFVHSGWDIKHLMKKIVMSATYRQASSVPPELREQDPENEWLARGPASRLSAEMIRDNALAASGLLNTEIGGPSVKPYQPEGLWSESSTFSRVLRNYEQDHGENLYRRSLYTFWRRTIHHPVMANFDAPNRDNCSVRRQGTNTPLQALTLFNEPLFVESSRALAQRVMTKASGTEAQIQMAYRLLTGLELGSQALDLLLELHEGELQRLTADPEDAKALLTVGEFPVEEHLDPIQLAAMTVACNTMLNFDETVTKR